MTSFYYLVAQLPYLVYNQQPPMSSQDFKELALPWLSKRDAGFLEQISLDTRPLVHCEDNESTEGDAGGSAESARLSYAEKASASGSSFIDKWREWERTLRLSLAKARSVKLGRQEQTAEPQTFYDDISAVINKAMEAAQSPLEAEMIIDKARWRAIEKMQGNNHFSLNTVLAYLLKLLILERHASFKVETGFSEYESLYASIMKKGTTIVGDIK